MDGFLQQGYSNGYIYLFKIDGWMYQHFLRFDASTDILSMPDYIQRDYFSKFGKLVTIEILEELKKDGLEEKIYIEIRRDLLIDNILRNGR